MCGDYMILFPLIFGCIPQEDGNQFGVASSASEQNFDTEEANSELEDSSAEESDTPLDSTPFSVDSSVVCGNRTVGTEVGDCALNFALLNQDAELVDLHSFVGSVVFLDLSDFT